MKLKILLIAILGANIAMAETPSRDQLIGAALTNYGNIAGGWYLNQRCSFLGNESAAKFSTDVGAITTGLRQELGEQNILLNIQASAKKVASSEKFNSCGDDAKEIVVSTSTLAHSWASQIGQHQQN